MIINATVKLHYKRESMAHYEGLYMSVSFKGESEWIGRTTEKKIVSTYNYYNAHLIPDEGARINSMEEFYDLVEHTIENEEVVIELAKGIIRKYYSDRKILDKDERRTEDIIKRVKKLPKYEIRVEVK